MEEIPSKRAQKAPAVAAPGGGFSQSESALSQLHLDSARWRALCPGEPMALLTPGRRRKAPAVAAPAPAPETTALICIYIYIYILDIY